MKTIEITDINQFYKNIFWYKKPWHNKTTFISKIQDEQLQYAIKALNIKKRNKRIEFVYDAICKYIDDYYAGENICSFCNNKCLVQTGNSLKFTNGCCRLCRYQSSKGCKSSNISCKLFYCDSIKKNHKIMTYKDIKLFKLFSLRQRLMCTHNFFASREAILLDLKIGSILIYGYRLLYRIAINLLWLQFKLPIIHKQMAKNRLES